MMQRVSRITAGLSIALTVTMFGVGFVAFSLFSPNGNTFSATLDATSLYGTVCAVASAQGTPFIWSVYGTPTPTPTRIPRNTASPEDIARLPDESKLETPYALKVGKTDHGKMLYDGVGQCAACHAVTDSATALVGPSLAHIATIARFRLAGVSAETYIRDSILYPNEHLVDGYTANVMPRSYMQNISPPEIEDLVAYLLTLK